MLLSYYIKIDVFIYSYQETSKPNIPVTLLSCCFMVLKGIKTSPILQVRLLVGVLKSVGTGEITVSDGMFYHIHSMKNVVIL